MALPSNPLDADISGAEARSGRIVHEDVLLHDCKLDYANLRSATLRHVTFSC
jgi:uncharacterized protein YjbI with pentapeptide repeats